MNLVELLPRIVLPHRVILPTDEELKLYVNCMDIKGENHTHGRDMHGAFDLEDYCRFDRPTGLRDKSGKMIYENDCVRVETFASGIPIVYRQGEFRFGNRVYNGLISNFTADELEVTGMVPYSPA